MLPIIGDKVPIRPLVLALEAIGARIGGVLPIIGDKVPIRPLVLAFGGDLGPDRRAAADNRQ